MLRKTVKYFFTIFVLVATMCTITSCSKEEPLSADELFWQENGVFENLLYCESDQYYTVVVTDEVVAYTEKGVWCKVVRVPIIVELCARENFDMYAPRLGDYLYCKRSDFEGYQLNIGDNIEVFIYKYGPMQCEKCSVSPKYACLVVPM